MVHWLFACIVLISTGLSSVKLDTPVVNNVNKVSILDNPALTEIEATYQSGSSSQMEKCSGIGTLVSSGNSGTWVIAPSSIFSSTSGCFSSDRNYHLSQISIWLTSAYTGNQAKNNTPDFTVNPASISAGEVLFASLLPVQVSAFSSQQFPSLPLLSGTTPVQTPCYALDLQHSGQNLSLAPVSMASQVSCQGNDQGQLHGLSNGTPVVDSNGALVGIVSNIPGKSPSLIQGLELGAAFVQTPREYSTLQNDWQIAVLDAYQGNTLKAVSELQTMQEKYPNFKGSQQLQNQLQPPSFWSYWTGLGLLPVIFGILIGIVGLSAVILVLIFLAQKSLTTKKKKGPISYPAPPAPPYQEPVTSYGDPAAPALDVSQGYQPEMQPQNPHFSAYDVKAESDRGIKRADVENEDSYVAVSGSLDGLGEARENIVLLIVSDGMGGHADGQVASGKAVEVVESSLTNQLKSATSIDDDILKRMITEAIHSANKAIFDINTAKTSDMGATITMAVLYRDRAVIANVGDSRTYLFNTQSGLKKVTQDHSVVASLVSTGVITEEEVYTHPSRNQIYRSLGKSEEVEVDTFVETLADNDMILLCTDGLWEMVHTPDLLAIVSAGTSPELIVQECIKRALANGGEDNVTAVIAQLKIQDQPISYDWSRVSGHEG